MDHIDRKIIDLLQNNARAPLKEIADHVFLSSPAVSARMARLEYIREHFPKLEYEARFDLYFACMTVMLGSLRCFRGDDLETARKEIYGALEKITPLPANPNAGAKKNALLRLSQRCFEPTCRLMNLLTDLHILT